jgi:hypothetical protein
MITVPLLSSKPVYPTLDEIETGGPAAAASPSSVSHPASLLLLTGWLGIGSF